MFGVGAQQDVHIPGKKGPTCQQPKIKFLAKGRGKGVGVGCLGVTKAATQKGTGEQVLLEVGPNLPPPHIPQHWCQAFLSPGLRGSPTPTTLKRARK